MMCRPSGLMRGLSTGLNSGSSMAMARVTPAAMSVRNSPPLMVNATRLPAVSTEYPTIPEPPSRARSRLAFSSAGTSSASASASSVRGSASRTSLDSPSSPITLIHSEVTVSSGPSERRNNAREPSPITRAERGAPQVNRKVRAFNAGNSSIALTMPSNLPTIGTVPSSAVRKPSDTPTDGTVPPTKGWIPPLYMEFLQASPC